jgi:Tfp pilus assembly protein PilN
VTQASVTQVNLLPQEVRGRRKVRQLTMAAIGAVAAVLVLLMAVFVLQSSRLGKVDQQFAAQEAVNAGLTSKVARLQKFADLKASVAARQSLVDGLLAGQILWSDVLQSISASTPDGLWFTSVSGTLNEVPNGKIFGSIVFVGKALTHRDVADWLVKVDQIKGWANSWISSSTRSQTTGTSEVDFNGSVDVTAAGTANGRRR